MTGRKSIAERVRERALAIHRRHCPDPSCGEEPSLEEREQAAREVMAGFLAERARAAGEGAR